MPNGICIFSENFNNILDPAVAELVTAARKIKEITGEPVSALVIAKDCSELIEQLEQLDIDAVYAVDTKRDCLFSDDALCRVAAKAVAEIAPSAVLIPATGVGRSLFSRAAVITKSGLTADCTDLEVLKYDDGSFYIKQNKPSFGENVMVGIITKKECYPQMMTVRQGVYPPCESAPAKKPSVSRLEIEMPESDIEILEMRPQTSGGESISAAEVVVVGGRGALSGENLELLKRFTEKLGGALAGTRPLADEGIIPFENQIGQTGCTIRPKICLSFGVSGAIQHTEGIKDTKLYIAVNTDKNAPVFNTTDYGIEADMKDVLEEALKISM